MLRLDLVHRTMERATSTNIIFLDACRNNPLARNLARAMGTRSTEIGRGLAAVESGVGTLISFSTQPGNVALDGTGRNSPFAGALINRLSTSSDDLSALLIDVRNDVRKETQNKQVPWEHSALTGRFYFGARPTAPSTASNEAERAWGLVKDTTNVSILEEFVRRYGDTFYATLARARLEELKRQQVATVAPPVRPVVPPKTDAPAPAAATSPMPGRSLFTDGVIKLGIMNDQSGLFSGLSGQGSVWAANKAIEDFCKSTRCYDKIEVVFADHQNKPDVGSNIARQWYDVDKVDVLVDVPTSSVALAISEITKEKNKVFLSSGAASSDLTGKACTPNTIHWTYDTWSLAHGTTTGTVRTGGDTWFILTADYAFGHALERDTEAMVRAKGGKVLGKVRHPFPNQDFSSFLLQAQSSKAKIIALANAGGDTINTIKQASEFGIVAAGQNLAGLLVFITDVHALGLQTAQGLILTEAWYWDGTDANRAFAKEFAAANKGNMPNMVHAGVYSAVTHYLKAVHELKSDADGAAVVAKMKSMPTDDKLFGKGAIRTDGRKIHEMHVFEVKKPSESKGPWDYYKLRTTIPAANAFRPVEQGGCPLAKQ
jgi:branched-chain amino acid transport system substrate-binding protein